MSEVTVASTTDTQESVNRAAGLEAGGAESAQQTGQSEQVQSGEEHQPQNPLTAEDTEERGGTGERELEAAPPESSDAKRKTAVQKRIDTLTRRMYEQQEELDTLRERLNQPGKQIQDTAEAPAGSAAGGATRADAALDGRPVPTKFRSHDEYVEALADWKAGQRLQQQKQAELAQAEQERTREVFDHYNEAAKAARVKYEDFEEVVGRRDLKIPQAVQVAIIEAGDAGPDIAYYLGKHPELCQELAEMSPMRAIARIGQIENQVTGDRPQVTAEGQQQIPLPHGRDRNDKDTDRRSPSQRKPMTSAPAPITPVGGGSSKTTVPLGELPYRDYKRLRDKEEAANYR